MAAKMQFAIKEVGSLKQYVVVDAVSDEQARLRFNSIRHRVLGLPGHDRFEVVQLLQNTPISVAWFKDDYFDGSNYPDKALSSDPRLVQLLIAKAFVNGHDIHVMCNHLRITTGFFDQLRNNIRSTKDISEELIAEIVDYLGVPVDVVRAAIQRA